MIRVWRSGLAAGAMGGILLSLASIALAGNSDPAGPPTGEPRFKSGDLLTVAADRANLMVGNQVLAALPKGQQIVVADVRGAWVGAYVLVGGQQRAGWIQIADFVPVPGMAQSEPRIYSVARPVEPAAPQPVVVPIAPGPSQASVDREYYIGYYLNHETDPNVHTWEPWRR